MTTFSSLRSRGADFIELLGSMRFAISLLMFICIASLIGTVVPQNQSANSYIDQFGPFWFAVFDEFSIWHIYNSPWFLVVMGFLVVSTTICIFRNAPKMIRDARSFKEYVRGTSLRAFGHKLELDSSYSTEQARDKITPLLKSLGYRFRIREDDDKSLMIAAKKGSANRLGYIFAHVAIVVICLGGLLDSELPVRLQSWLLDKQPVTGNMLISQVPESGRLPAINPSFRANMLLPDGKQSSMGIIQSGNGVLLQPLPFIIELEKFYVTYYPNGQPSDFRSDVKVTDLDTGDSFKQTIKVNEPLQYKGITVYQSSFDDGGSALELKAWPMTGTSSTPFDLKANVGDEAKLPGNLNAYTVDYSNLRVINVENMADGSSPQPDSVIDHVASVTGTAARRGKDNLKNIGPSVEYRLIGADGQAFEYNQYMLPVDVDGSSVFLLGMRKTEAEPYRYLRIPADINGSIDEFMHLRAALANDDIRDQAAHRFAADNAPEGEQRDLMYQAAKGALATFSRDGFNGIIQAAPVDQREKIMNFTVPMIQISLAEIRDIMHEQNGQSPVSADGSDAEFQDQWLRQALLALASLPDYPAPVALQLTSFDQVQASVFQVARTPGKFTVYLGCLFLVIGVFSMFYIHERRIWVWIRPKNGGSSWFAAMTAQKRTMDFNHEFEKLSAALRKISGGSGNDN